MLVHRSVLVKPALDFLEVRIEAMDAAVAVEYVVRRGSEPVHHFPQIGLRFLIRVELKRDILGHPCELLGFRSGISRLDVATLGDNPDFTFQRHSFHGGKMTAIVPIVGDGVDGKRAEDSVRSLGSSR